MIIIFGLGNIGKEYEQTYHNIGFETINAFCKKHNLVLNKNKYFGLFCETILFGEKVIFVKPTTFMNNSGTCVKNFVKKFKASVCDILVVYDDFDLPIGCVRFRNSGQSGTHNGMRDIVEQLKSEDFKRLRIGIRDDNKNIPLINYVLSGYKKGTFDLVFEKTNEFLEDFIKNNGKVENKSL